MNEVLQHLVLVRHGESEGDARRAAWNHGENHALRVSPEFEEITDKGLEQCRQAGLWIAKYVIAAYGLKGFDGCYVSSALRSEQSAVALDLPVAVWQEDACLNERNRGKIRGLRPEQHLERYPESFEQMTTQPLYWTPPEGESVIPDVVARNRQFRQNIEDATTVLAVTHRDWIWAEQLISEQLSEAELSAVNTDDIHNAQVIHLTSIDPKTGQQAPALLWKRTVDPAITDGPGEWQLLAHVAERYSLSA